MQYYEVFGGCLQSEIAFPELPQAKSQCADWTLRLTSSPNELLAPTTLGEELLFQDLKARLVRAADRFRLSFDDTGVFDVSLDGREITWSPTAGASPETARSDILSRVLSLAIHVRGGVCLHASCVSLRDGAIAFLGPKGRGKTTLALALMAEGWRLLADDTLCVNVAAPITVAPGVLSMRIRPDVAQHLGRRGDASSEHGDEKRILRNLAPHEMALARVPLLAVYVLSPMHANARSAAVHRRALSPVESTLAVVHHAKISSLLGRGETGPLLERAAALTGAVPVYALDVVRDLERLNEVVEQLAMWHHGSALRDDLASSA